MSKIALLMITHNRLVYTKKALSLLLCCQTPFDLYIVDNASIDDTQSYLTSLQDERIHLQMNSHNESLATVTNEFWRKTIDHYDLVGKVDNDTLVQKELFDHLIAAHQGSERIAAIGGFTFNYYADWNFEHSKRNIRELQNGHKILIQGIIGGAAYLAKSSIIQEIGFIREIVLNRGDKKVKGIIYGWQDWQRVAQQKGYVVGYYFPLILTDHMDDPLSPNCLLDRDPSVTKLAQENCYQRDLPYSRESLSVWTREAGVKLLGEYVYDHTNFPQTKFPKEDVGKKVYT